jgi:hypothetical protein
MQTLMIIIFTLLAISVNVIWYKIKFVLKDNDYDVHFFFSHLSDIPNMISLIRKTENKEDKKGFKLLLSGLFINIIVFIGLIILSITMEWI